ncbi:MAG: hypothetical protein LUQ54_01425 [Methanoregula sp.]|nr:hypothetical protein [Methanoregula sp.]
MTGQPNPALRTATIRLVLIPITIYMAWMLETYLLEGSMDLFVRFNPSGLFLYTIIACIITGMIIPLICIRKSFISGSVNMFQIGFRSLRRTILSAILTFIIAYSAVIIFGPFGEDRLMIVNGFLLLLPGVIASVMICWVLIGTHIQAFVRSGGAIISVSVGVLVTATLFGLTTFAFFPSGQQDTFFLIIALGIIAGFFFFAVRDVYSTIIIAGVGSIFAYADRINPAYLHNTVPAVWICSVLTIGSLIGIHVYLSQNFTTIRNPG